MRKVSISVLSNFAEGFDREGNNELVQFLAYWKGSIGELRGQLICAADQELLPNETQMELDQLARSASRLVGGLMTYLASGDYRGRKYLNLRNQSLSVAGPSEANIDAGYLPTENRKLKTGNR